MNWLSILKIHNYSGLFSVWTWGGIIAQVLCRRTLNQFLNFRGKKFITALSFLLKKDVVFTKKKRVVCYKYGKKFLGIQKASQLPGRNWGQ